MKAALHTQLKSWVKFQLCPIPAVWYEPVVIEKRPEREQQQLEWESEREIQGKPHGYNFLFSKISL